jgi:hypothetical protein
MSTLKPKVIITRAIAFTVSVLMICVQSGATFAQDHCWTTSGSTGTVDHLDSAIVSLTSNRVGVKTSVASGTVNVRYNVVAVEGIFGGGNLAKTMLVRFTDNGANAQVVVQLKRLNITSGTITTLANFDSNIGVSPSASAQTKETGFNCGAAELNFEENVFFIDASLKKDAISGQPAGRPSIDAIKICNTVC